MATAQEVPGIEASFQLLELANVTPSPMNPRKRFDERSLKELADSIRTHGVQQPILVRPIRVGKGKSLVTHEIVVGERRYKASRLAGRTHIPSIIREISDADALEIMVIENLQREDVHPLDEALGYEALMKRKAESDPELGELPGAPNHTAESIAAKVGKSVGYVYARLKLLALIGITREAFDKDLITPGHAVLIARLQPIDQVRALDACFHHWRGIGDREIRKLDPAKVKLEDLHIEPLESGLLPEKALREWIQENINLRLKDVPWDLNDAELLPEAGACANCLKRSASNPGLFGELAVKGEDTCFDEACFKLKREAFVKRTIRENKQDVKVAQKVAVEEEAPEQAKKVAEKVQPLLQLSDLGAYTQAKPDQAVYREGQWIPAKPNSCPDTRKGIMVRGENAGQEKMVCVNPKCKVHKHTNYSNRSNGGSGQEHDHDEEQFKQHRNQMRENKKARGRGRLCQAIIEKVGTKLDDAAIGVIASAFFDQARVEPDVVSWLAGETKPLSEPQIRTVLATGGARANRLLLAIALEDGLTGWNSNDAKERERLLKIGKALGLKNPAGVLKDADTAIATAPACRACGCTEEIPCEFWSGNKKVRCSWKEEGLCSNPKCVAHDAKAKKA